MKLLFTLMQVSDIPNPMLILVLMLGFAFVYFFIMIYLVRWIFKITKIVSALESQLRTQEEMIIQNEKIIRLLTKIAGDADQSEIKN